MWLHVIVFCFVLFFFNFSLRSLSYWSLAPGAVREAWWRTLIACDLRLDYYQGPSLISINLTSLSVTVKTSCLSCLFYFIALRSWLSLCMNVWRRSKMLFTLTAKSKWCLTYPFYVFKNKPNKITSSHKTTCELFYFLCTIYFSDASPLLLPWSTVKPLLVPIW